LLETFSISILQIFVIKIFDRIPGGYPELSTVGKFVIINLTLMTDYVSILFLILNRTLKHLQSETKQIVDHLDSLLGATLSSINEKEMYNFTDTTDK